MRYTVLAIILMATASFADDNVFLNTDVFELEVASDPQISPDGSRVVYVRRSHDIMTDRAVGSLWIVDSEGERHRPLLGDGEFASSPRWSPSGDRLAYVASDGDNGSQLFLMWMDSGQTTVLTNVRGGPGSLTWSPNGESIAFDMFVPAEPAALATPPAQPDGAEWAPPVTVIEQMRYRADGSGYLESGTSQLFVVSADGGTARQITDGEQSHAGPYSWSGDSSTIYFAANLQPDADHDPLESEVWSIAIADGELQQITDRNGPDFSPVVSPDGTKLAYLGFDDRGMGYHSADVHVMDLADGSIRVITESFDRTINDVQWAGSSNRLIVQYDDYGKTNLATLTIGGRITSIADDVGGAILGRPYTSGGFSVAANGAYAYTAGKPDRPADVAVGRGNRSARHVTALNEDSLGHKALGQVEALTWKSSADDLEIQGWIVTPPGFDPAKKYPLLLEIHGGPFAAYGPQFSPEVQLFAAAGYVVLYSNPRGSTSYGYDFANEIHHNYPSQDYDDLMSGVDAVISRGYIDEEALYVTGGSGGGVLTAWIVGKTDRFRAAVVAKPVIDWASFALTSDGAPFYSMYWFDKMPWEDPQSYWARSPLSLVGNVTTPTALLTGEVDYRTPLGQSEQYYQALKIRKVDTILVQIPEASHGIVARPSHLIAKVDNILAWFARYPKEN